MKIELDRVKYDAAADEAAREKLIKGARQHLDEALVKLNDKTIRLLVYVGGADSRAAALYTAMKEKAWEDNQDYAWVTDARALRETERAKWFQAHAGNPTDCFVMLSMMTMDEPTLQEDAPRLQNGLVREVLNDNDSIASSDLRTLFEGTTFASRGLRGKRSLN